MSSYFSGQYLFLFLPIVVVIYNILPKKIRPAVLLIASYVFFCLISKTLILYLLLSSLSIYGSGLLMRKIDNKRNKEIEKLNREERKLIKEKYKRKKRIILILTILFNIAFLFFFKYLKFFTRICNGVLYVANSDYRFKIIRHLAPIGISFYTLQAISYLIDVYNEKTEASKNILKVFLYLAFFPTVMEGPITRFEEVGEEIYKGNRVTYHNFCFGCQRILYGLLKKYIIADRLNAVVKLVFEYYNCFAGPTIMIGAIFYTIMLYMEFSGTMDVVIGSAEMFDIKIPENFRQPFFSKNISEFWSRWHISLGLWFKNYIFYPVSLSKPVKNISGFIRKKFGNRASSLVMGAIALFAVWSLNGLWHGAGWTFILYGYYHFTLILLENIFEPTVVKVCEKVKINRKSSLYKSFQVIKTSILVFIGELIFRANGLRAALGMLKRMFTNFNFAGTRAEFFDLGLDIKDYIILVVALALVIVVSILKERGVNIREKLASKNIVLRWTVFYALILGIVVFGAYGPGYQPVEPMYADF